MPATGIAALMHLLQPLAAMLVLVSATVASTNCTSRCGTISIPYPFGISTGCHREGFKLDCNETYHPPKLFMKSSGVEVLEISAQDSTLWIDSGILTLVAGDKGHDGFVHMNWSVPFDHSLYRVLTGINQVIILGCGFLALLEWPPPDGGELEGASCALECMPDNTVIATDGTCSGIGCCSTNVVELDSNMFLIKISMEKKNLPVNSSLALVESKWWSNKKNVMVLQKGVSSDTSLGASEGVLHSVPGTPIRTAVSWVFSNSSCDEARNSSDFGCLSDNSDCLDYLKLGGSTTGGYRCQCWHGYEGNPYERHGCQDIDECTSQGEHYCFGQCRNLMGSHTCTCPQGTTGNPREQNGCSSTKSDKANFSGFATAIGIASGVGVLLIILGVLLAGILGTFGLWPMAHYQILKLTWPISKFSGCTSGG